MNKLLNNFTIRGKIFLSTVAISLLVATTLIVFNYQFAANVFIKEASDDLVEISLLKKQSIEVFIKNSKARIVDFTFDGKIQECLLEIQNNNQSVCTKQELINYLKNNKFLVMEDLLTLTILDSTGQVVVATDEKIKLDQSQSSSFIKGQKEPYFEEIKALTVENFEDSLLRFEVSAPILLDGKLIGVIKATLKSDELSSVVEAKSFFKNSEESFIVNRDGFFLTEPKFIENVVLKQKIETQAFLSCDAYLNNFSTGKKNQPFIYQPEFYPDYRGVSALVSAQVIPETKWCVLSKIDQKEIFILINKHFYNSLLISFVLLAIVVISSLFFSTFISSPIRKLEEDVRGAAMGDLNHKIGNMARDEIGSLSRTFDEMKNAIKQSRAQLDKKVVDQTSEIIKTNQILKNQTEILENQRLAALNILEDIDKEKNISIRIAKDLEKFKLAVENVSNQIVITDKEGIVLYANQAMKKITGYTNQEALGKKAGKLWGNLMSKKYFEFFWKTIKVDKKTFIGEIKNRRKNGEEYIAEIRVSPILDEGGGVVFFVAIERDISKIKEIDRMKTEFLSVAAHQLRTPLGSMRWNLEMLLSEDAGKLNEEMKEILESVFESNKNLLLIVNDLLNVSRIDQGRVSDKPELLNPMEVLKEVAQELTVLAKQKNVKLNLGKLFSTSPQIKLDKRRLRDIFSNLISNAIKYNKIGGKIDISCQKIDKAIQIKIADTGVGIPKEDQRKLFAKFFRATNAIKNETEGSGMGLFVVKSYLEAWGGSVSFKSIEGKGTIFIITIPLEPKNQTLNKNLENRPHQSSGEVSLKLVNHVNEDKNLLTKAIGVDKIKTQKSNLKSKKVAHTKNNKK